MPELCKMLQPSWLTRLVERWYGYDFFIAYRRTELSAAYARSLSRSLETWEAPLRPFLDERPDGFQAGGDLSAETRRVAALSSALIVVVDQTLINPESKHVPGEVALFEDTNKPIVPIDLDGTLDKLRERSGLVDDLHVDTARMIRVLLKKIALTDHRVSPSDGLVEKLAAVIGSVTVLRRRIRRLFVVALMMGCLALVAWLFWMKSERIGRIERAMRCAAVSQLYLDKEPRFAEMMAVEAVQSTLRAGEPIASEALSAVQIANSQSLGLSWTAEHGLDGNSSTVKFALVA